MISTATAEASHDRSGDYNAGSPSNELPVIAIAGVVHDIGNLIQIASSAVSLIVREPDMPIGQAGPMLARAKASLDHAAALVRRNLSMIRQRDTAEVASSNVAACLQDVATLIEAIGEPGLTLELAVDPGLPRVRCDPMAFLNAVLNLVFNARDAMSGQGRVTIAARALRQGHLGEGVEIHIADEGVGMTRSTIARAFAPFFTTKNEGLGGVGLPMVERFVRSAGGEILVDSEPGVGTVVTLRLPGLGSMAALPIASEESKS
jgi:signal transduction histidine kinase